MMSKVKVEALLQGQTGLARKVYEATPIRTAWLVSQISGAMDKSGADAGVVRACLRDLREAGLVREVGSLFQRVEVRTLSQPKLQETKEPAVPTPTETKKATPPLELLADLSGELISIANDFGTRVKRLAARLEEVALSIEQERENSAENLGKLAQLQSILKSLS